MSAGEICNREVVIAQRGETALQAAKLMRRHHVGDLVVIDEQAGRRVPVGMLTDRDLVLEILAEESGPEEVTVGDIMTRDPLLVAENDELIDVVKRMRERGVRRVPVVDADGALQGILALDDIIDIAAEQLSDLVKLIGRERRRESRSRS